MDTSAFAAIERKYPSFSRTYKLIADYILADYKKVSFLSVQKLGEELGVSTASIVRFCQDLGFSGYAEFQREARALVQGESPAMMEFRSAVSGMEDEPLREILRLNIEILKKTYTETLSGEFNKAVDAIHAARKVYVIGMRSSYSVAYYLAFMLSQFMDNVELATAGSGDIFDRLCRAEPEDLAIVVSFSRYTRLTVEAADFLRERNVPIIALTDAQSSPIATKAAVTLQARSSRKNYSFVSAMTIADALTVAVGKKDKDKTLQRIKEKETVNIQAGIYFEKTAAR